MATDFEEVVRAELKTWAEGLTIGPLSGAITVNSEPPQPGPPTDLPTLAMWFQATTWEDKIPTVQLDDLGDPVGGGRTVWKIGEKEASMQAMWRLSSFDDVKLVRRDFVNESMLTSILSNRGNLTVLHLPITTAGVDGEVRVYWDASDRLADPRQTGIRDLYELTYSATVNYPWLVQEAAPGSGIMNIKVDLNDDPTFDMDNYQTSGPAE